MKHSHPIVAAVYDRFCASCERAFLAALRDEVIGHAQGTVVELGAGTGLNLPHYRPANLQVLHAVEPDPYMRRQAERRVADAGIPIEFCDATAERLPYPAGHADAVVGTLFLCSVDDPGGALREVRRVLKPGGLYLFIEHIRSDRPMRARLQDWVTPLWRHISANCHVNRATLQLLRQAGFEVEETGRAPKQGPWGNDVVAGSARVVSPGAA